MGRAGRALIFVIFIAVLSLFCLNPNLAHAASYEDGTYNFRIDRKGDQGCGPHFYTGGSGRGGPQSAEITVSGGNVTQVTITMSSANYDYAIVKGATINADTGSGNSKFTFQYPGNPFTIAADTTAMSQPHEIDYTVTLDFSDLPVAEAPVQQVTDTKPKEPSQSKTPSIQAPSDDSEGQTPAPEAGKSSDSKETEVKDTDAKNDKPDKDTKQIKPKDKKEDKKDIAENEDKPVKGKSSTQKTKNIIAGILIVIAVVIMIYRYLKGRKKS